MNASTIALLILLPAALVFVYAGWHEYRRYKAEGPSNYGLTYDPETNTTHVGPLSEGEDSYDPDDFEPVNEDRAEDTHPEDDPEQDRRT
jgi:hypothetical protein